MFHSGQLLRLLQGLLRGALSGLHYHPPASTAMCRSSLQQVVNKSTNTRATAFYRPKIDILEKKLNVQ